MVQAILAAFFLVVVGSGLWSITQEQGGASTSLPHSIASFNLLSSVSGDEAQAEIRQLHGRDLGLKRAWVAHYQGSATIWVGEAESPEEATALIGRMTSRIEAGNPTFSNLQSVQIDGQPYYSVTEGGHKHYYYLKGAKVIWIAPPAGKETDFLREARRLIS